MSFPYVRVISTTKIKDETLERVARALKDNFLFLKKDKDGSKKFYTFLLHKCLPENIMEKMVEVLYTNKEFENATFENSIEDDTNISTDMLEDLAKFMHTKYIEEKVKAGWNYGEDYSFEKKTSPLLVPYEQLPEEYKELRPDIFEKVVEILNKKIN